MKSAHTVNRNAISVSSGWFVEDDSLLIRRNEQNHWKDKSVRIAAFDLV